MSTHPRPPLPSPPPAVGLPWLPRENLLQRLAADAHKPLLCITGRAGLGKSLLLEQWLQVRDGKDQHLEIIEDAHEIEPAEFAERCRQTLERAGRLVLVGRAALNFPGLARLRAHERITCLEEQDLCFNRAETRAYFATICGLEMTQAQLNEIDYLYQGWPVGIRLLAQELHASRRAQQSDKRLRLDYPSLFSSYVIEECLPPTTAAQDALLLEHMGGELDAGLDCVLSRVFIRHLESCDPDRLRLLRLKSAAAMLQAGDWGSAIEQLLDAGENEQAAELIAKFGSEYHRSGNRNALMRLIRRLPTIVCDNNAGVLYYWALCAFEENPQDLQAPTRQLERAESRLLTLIPGQRPDGLLRDISLLKARFAHFLAGEQDNPNVTWYAMKDAAQAKFSLGAVTHLGRAMEHYCRGELDACENDLESAIQQGKRENFHLVTVIAASYFTTLLLRMGRGREAIARYRAIAEWIEGQPQQVFPRAYVEGGPLASVYIEAHDLKNARRSCAMLAQFVDSDLAESHQACSIAVMQAQLALAEGDFRTFDLALEKAGTFSGETDSWQWFFVGIDALRAGVAMQKGSTISAIHWADKNLGELAQATDFRSEVRRLILSRILIEQGRFAETAPIVEAVLAAALQRKDMYHQTWALILQAFMAQENPARLDKLMHKATARAAAAEFYQLFVSQGKTVLALLQLWLAGGPQLEKDVSRFLKKLLPLLETRCGAANATPVEGLSERELEVLELIAQGLRNKEIAQRLKRSPATIKSHLHNSFSKLGVKSRTEAIARLRQLGLLD